MLDEKLFIHFSLLLTFLSYQTHLKFIFFPLFQSLSFRLSKFSLNQAHTKSLRCYRSVPHLDDGVKFIFVGLLILVSWLTRNAHTKRHIYTYMVRNILSTCQVIYELSCLFWSFYVNIVLETYRNFFAAPLIVVLPVLFAIVEHWIAYFAFLGTFAAFLGNHYLHDVSTHVLCSSKYARRPASNS